MKRRFLLIFPVLIFVFPVLVFPQQQAPSAGVLRDYVGLINQSYHPGIVAYFEKTKTELERNGQNNAAKSIDLFLKGATGSGFIIPGASGNFYVVTNYHVIQQAHTLSITFERQDNYKRKYENLTVIAADEELDLALLAFPAADKPSAGLSLLTRLVDEGEDVYAAGFPVLGATPLWQFSRGMVSNSSARFPKSIYDETLMGPYIQHTAQIDPGNSGGPLLVVQRNAVSGYAVAGINTLSAIRRQTANYAIPAPVAQTFINSAINQKPETYKDALDKRLDKFLNGLGEHKAVYPHIAEYLSSVCVGENAEYAMSEMYDRGNTTVRRAFIEKCEESVVGAMGYAVAWTIENSLRAGQQGPIKASLKEVTGAGEEYTVTFNINNKDVNSIWIREYGNWRIKSFGSVASGDKSLMSKKEADKKAKKNLRTNSVLQLETGYANLFKKTDTYTAFYFSLDFLTVMGFNLYYVNDDLSCFGMFLGYQWSIPTGNFGFMPYLRLGTNFMTDSGFEESKTGFADGFPIAFTGQVGLKITTSFIPGLFVGTAFQLNLFSLTDYDNLMKSAFCVTAGYAF
jgi:serine protease Do